MGIGNKIKLIMLSCFLLIAAVMVEAAAAIAKECYNSDKLKPEFFDNAVHKTNAKFLTYLIIGGVLCILCAILGIVIAVKAPV
jgi:hypothetical protein